MISFSHQSATGDENGEKSLQEVAVMHNGSKEGAGVGKEPQDQTTILPTHRINHNGHRVHKYIHPDGESGRAWIHPWHFIRICFRSSCDASCIVNILWPIVPVAIALNYARTDLHLPVFILNYIGMVPCANLVGFAGQELARKLPRVVGILLETTLGSVVEIILFMVLLSKDEFAVIQAAIVGSILSTMLLCLGMCFFVGGLRREEQCFDEAIGEVGNGLLLTA
jgi:Ca2+:H+ antiporter